MSNKYVGISLLLATLCTGCAIQPLSTLEQRQRLEAVAAQESDAWPSLRDPTYFEIPDPDIELALSEEAINRFVSSLIGNRLEISLEKEGQEIGLHYGVINRLISMEVTPRNTLRLSVQGHLHAKAWFARANVGIDEFEIEIRPYIMREDDGRHYIGFDTAVTKLRMADFKKWESANKYLARLLTRKINEDQLKEPLPDLQPAAGGEGAKKGLSPELKQIVLVIKDKRVILQAARKMPAPA